jgi:endoglucanase
VTCPSALRRGLLAALGLICVLAFATPASAGVANAGLYRSANPLAGLQWGLYTGPIDDIWPAYSAATGTARQLLAKIAMRPRVTWFGDWYGAGYLDAEQAAQQYIANVTGGDPNILVQMAVFRLEPWEHAVCHRLPTADEQASYRDWIDGFAAGIGLARVALVLQPDLPFALCVPHHSALPLQLVAYAAQMFSALPHTTVYIDVGASDWPSVGQAGWMLRWAGIRYARGFALGATHYTSNEDEVQYGAKVSAELAKHRVRMRNRHFVINTADNGRPFTYYQYHGPDFDNAAPCRRKSSKRCVTLGMPPTTRVTARAAGLSKHGRALAARLVDAYLWIGRPWLFEQAAPFDLARALQVARTSPF